MQLNSQFDPRSTKQSLCLHSYITTCVFHHGCTASTCARNWVSMSSSPGSRCIRACIQVCVNMRDSWPGRSHLSCPLPKQKPIVVRWQTDRFNIAPCNRKQIKSLHHCLRLLLDAINCLHQWQPFFSLKWSGLRKMSALARTGIAVSEARARLSFCRSTKNLCWFYGLFCASAVKKIMKW